MTPTPGKSIGLTDACARLGIPYRRAWLAVVSGSICAVREGGRWQIPETELETLYLACVDGVSHDANH